MASKRIFITGGSGCIGHYIADLLIQRTDHELFFLIRNLDKVQFDHKVRPGIHLIQGDMLDIEDQAELLATIDVAILTANAWGGAQEVFDVNVARTTRLMKLLDPQRCQKVLYFSTASILGRNNQPLQAAKQLGTDYIRSKYDCFSQLPRLEIANKITVLFPTLVFGGSNEKPYSHLSGGLPEIVRWLGLVRFFTADASFHYLHAYDIAQVVTYLVDRPLPPKVVNAMDNHAVRQVILGNPVVQVQDAVREICNYFGKSIWFRLHISQWFANFIIRVFRIQMAAWDRFCMDYRHFCYQNPVNPEVLGLTPLCPTLGDVLQATGLEDKRSPRAKSNAVPPTTQPESSSHANQETNV